MKAILEFNLPEDQEDFNLAVNASNMYVAIHEMDQWLRSKIKYESDGMSQEEYNAYDKSREQLRSLIIQYNIPNI